MINEAMPMIKIEHMEKHFGALHALKDINLEVYKGDIPPLWREIRRYNQRNKTPQGSTARQIADPSAESSEQIQNITPH